MRDRDHFSLGMWTAPSVRSGQPTKNQRRDLLPSGDSISETGHPRVAGSDEADELLSVVVVRLCGQPSGWSCFCWPLAGLVVLKQTSLGGDPAVKRYFGTAVKLDLGERPLWPWLGAGVTTGKNRLDEPRLRSTRVVPGD